MKQKKRRKYLSRDCLAMCSRCRNLRGVGKKCEAADMIKERTGLPLSPYFSAAKLAWIMQKVPAAFELAKEKNLCVGTVDS